MSTKPPIDINKTISNAIFVRNSAFARITDAKYAEQVFKVIDSLLYTIRALRLNRPIKRLLP